MCHVDFTMDCAVIITDSNSDSRKRLRLNPLSNNVLLNKQNQSNYFFLFNQIMENKSNI